MGFPEVDRVIYDKNPLMEVLCQLQFPAILKIEAEPPISFQEAVREEYPYFSDPVEIAENPQFSTRGRRNNAFVSRDKTWRINLTRDFVALTTSKYVRWEDFQSRLSSVVETLNRIYKPVFFNRVGLRYKDFIIRSLIGLDKSYSWADLLNPELAGEFSSREISDQIRGCAKKLEFNFDKPKFNLLLNHGITQIDEIREEGYLIDSDFFLEGEFDWEKAQEHLNLFNQQARYQFRWSISDKLHQLLSPKPVE